MCTVPAIGTVPLVGTGPVVGNGIYYMMALFLLLGIGGAFPFSLYGGSGTAMV